MYGQWYLAEKRLRELSTRVRKQTTYNGKLTRRRKAELNWERKSLNTLVFAFTEFSRSLGHYLFKLLFLYSLSLLVLVIRFLYAQDSKEVLGWI